MHSTPAATVSALNESPSEKEGKFSTVHIVPTDRETLNESPSEKEGKFHMQRLVLSAQKPSMKVPPKRKGNKFLIGA